MLRGSQLLVVFADVKLLLNRQEMLYGVEVVFHLIEDTADVEDRDGALRVVLRLGEAAPLILEEEKVVVQCFEAFI